LQYLDSSFNETSPAAQTESYTSETSETGILAAGRLVKLELKIAAGFEFDPKSPPKPFICFS
jgi:hypothetical protein